jgi:diacylglycerol kinase family enzyme
MNVRANGRESQGVTAICQNSDPFTYFRDLPLRICDDVAADNGRLGLALLRRATQRDMPMITTRVLSKKLLISDHKQIDHFDGGVIEARIESVSRDANGALRPFPVEVDGDYIGDHAELELGIAPGALTVVA